MQKQPEIAFRDMKPSEAVRDKIRQRIKRLERYVDEIIGCRAVVETPHRRKHKGKLFHVSLDITVPGDEIVVDRNPQDDHAHEDVYVAIRNAFDAAERQLKEYAERRRGEAHRQPEESLDRGQGTISRLVPDEDHGFITPRRGTGHIYFHRDSIVGADFEELEEGDQVEYHEEQGEAGPQASTIHVLGRVATVPGS